MRWVQVQAEKPQAQVTLGENVESVERQAQSLNTGRALEEKRLLSLDYLYSSKCVPQ